MTRKRVKPAPRPREAPFPPPAERAATDAAPFPHRLLAALSPPLEERELIHLLFTAFLARYGATGARLAVCDRPGGAPVYLKDTRGRVERRPALRIEPRPGLAVVRVERGGDVEWQIPLTLDGATVGLLALEGGASPADDPELPAAAAVAALALFAARERAPDARPGLDDASLDALTLAAGATAAALIAALGGGAALFLRRRGERRDARPFGLATPEVPEIDRLLALAESFRRDEEEGILTLDETVETGGISWSSACFVTLAADRRDETAAFVALKRDASFDYPSLHAIRLVAGLAGRLVAGAVAKARAEREESRRALLAAFTRGVDRALAAPDRTEPLDALLALIAPRLPARLLALLPPDEGEAIPCSLGDAGRDALARYLSATNARLWIRDARGPLDLRGIALARAEADRFLAEIGADPLHASLAALGPVRDGDRAPSLLVAADRATPPELPLPDDRLERTLLDFARSLAHSAAERARAERERRELEKMERLAAIGEMAAGVAHEIRNPLGGIELYASSLVREETDPRRRNWLEAIVGATHKLNRIVSDLLVFAREEKIECRAVPLSSAVAEAALAVEPERAAKKARLELLPGDVSALADPVRLSQILVNLLRNALEAVAAGGRLRVSAARRGGRAVILVEDDGPGVPPEAARRIFDPFFTTRATGTGLGLPISLKLAERMGGSLALVPSSLGGAAFELSLAAPEEEQS